MTHLIVTLCLLMSVAAHAARLNVPLLANYQFKTDGVDSAGNSAPFFFTNEAFISKGTLEIAATNWNYNTAGAISGFNYSNFTVAVDFSGYDFSEEHGRHNTIITGGPAYRWLHLGVDTNQHLFVKLNNGSVTYALTNVTVTSNRWHTIACSVDLDAQRMIVFYDKKQVADIALDSFQFQVIGTPYEPEDKVFGFQNHGTASTFIGHADNLRVYSRALTAEELRKVKVHAHAKTKLAAAVAVVK